MIKLKITLLTIIMVGFLNNACNRNIAQSKKEKKYYYTCVMHPDDIYHQPGKCPKCGMSLEAWEMENMPKSTSGGHTGHSDSGGHSGGCH